MSTRSISAGRVTNRFAQPALTTFAAFAIAAWSPASSNGQTRDAKPPVTANAAYETWHRYRMAGQDVGYIHEATVREGDLLKTTVDMRVVINRLGSSTEIRAKTIYDETPDGELRSAHSELSSSRQVTTLDARVEKEAVRLQVSTGGKEYRRDLQYSGLLLGPSGVRARTIDALKAERKAVTYRTLVPEIERVVDVTRTLLERNVPLSASDAKPCYSRIEEKIEGFPSKRAAWLDSVGRVVRQTEPGPFGETELVLADRATALSTIGGQLPEEMFDRTLVRSNVRLPGPRSIDRLVLRLTQTDPTLGWPDFAGPGQAILGKDGDALLVETRRIRVEGSPPKAVKPHEQLAEFLAPNALVQSDDAEVQRIAQELAGSERDVYRIATRLRDWVQQNMTLDLGIALAPGSEAIRDRKGTCVAYAIALASLTRAVKIPSRVLMGYVYVSGIWGGHAWVEVWADGKWVPLDAAIPSTGLTDAARLACVRTSLAEGTGALVAALGRLAGNLHVAIVEYEVAGVYTKVSPAAKPFTVDGDTYRNPWLGIDVRNPAGFRFAKTDAVYPDSTVVAVEGPSRRRVEIRQESPSTGNDATQGGVQALRRFGFSNRPSEAKIAGRTALLVEAGEKAGLALPNGPDMWVLIAEGADAGPLVREIAETLTFRARGQ